MKHRNMESSENIMRAEASKKEEVEAILNPLVKEWFFGRFKEFSLTQLYGVKNIYCRKNILISAPTGGTKTLTAFLGIINYLVELALKKELEDKIYAVYVSPLKALSNDIFVNLTMPLSEISELAKRKGLEMQEIRVGLRTGDTAVVDRVKMAKKAPHIFVTTPESLAIVLTTSKSVGQLRALEFVIVDEIHALANKRGTYLSLTLERLCDVSVIEPVRIGLSATISPLVEIAKFLAGAGRECLVAEVKMAKKIEIELDFPGEDILEAENIESQRKLYHLLDEMIDKNRTTLIFTNTRSATERIIHYLDVHFPGKYTGLVGAHHSSMSKEKRFEIEDRLRKGELKVVVSSTSLELGIDIGNIDIVVMLRSPKSVSRALQRCLAYDSLVLCADGTYRKIGEIVEKKLPVEIISYDENKGFVKNKIAKWHDNGVEELIGIKLQSGEEIICTKEHPILTKEGWKEAGKIENSDLVAEARSDIKFDVHEPYLFELLPQDKTFVVNEDNFFQRIIDEHRKKNKINAKKFTKEFGMPYSRFIDCRRIKGRKKSIRLDYFLNACKLCGIHEKEYLPYLVNLKTKGTNWPKWPLKLTRDIMWLAGIVATDGCIVRSKGVEADYYKIKIGNKSKRMIDKLKEIVEKFDNKPYIAFKEGIYYFEFGSNLIAHLFMSLGIPCKNKSFDIDIGEKIYSLPNELIHSYLEGILEGDGNVNFGGGENRGMMRIFSASRKFAIGMHRLFSRMGYNNKVSKSKIKASRLIQKVSEKDMYCVGVFRKEDLRRFFENCLCYGERAQRGREAAKEFKPYLSEKENFNRFLDYSAVKNIEIHKKDNVYNLTLEKEPNNFVVGGVVVHNCGRAGHKLHENPRGKFIVLDRDDLVECGVMMKSMIEGKIDSVEIPKNCLDVLSQQIYGMAISRIWGVEEMLRVIRRSYCYSGLKNEDFYDVVSYLAGEYALEHRNVYAKIWHDAEKKQIGKRGKLARVIYMTNVGTIPEEGFINVEIGAGEAKGTIIGKIDEAFLERMKRGDIFVLGGQKYQFLFSRGMKAYVAANVAKNPTIPSWFSEMLPLNFELALEICRFRKLVNERLDRKEGCVEFIEKQIYCTREVAKTIYDYFNEQERFAAVPDEKTLVIEKFKEKKEYLMFHSLYGRRVNDALARAYAYAAGRLRERDVEIGVNDNGFFIAAESIDEEKILKLVNADNLETILKEAIEKTEVLRRRFRHCAARSLMILRNYKGREKSVGKQQVHSGLLYLAVKKLSNEFPILREARREVFEDLMDINNAKRVLRWIASGDLKIKKVKTPIASPFGVNLLISGKSDLIKMEDRASFLKRMHELHLKAIGEKRG
jgi:Lhr-like helicase